MAVARLKGAIRLGLLLLSVVVLGITIVLSVASATGAMQSPPPPTNVTATVYNEKITVSWTPAGGYSAYFAYRAVNGGSFTYYGYFSSVSSFDDISISPGNTYSYYLLT